MANSQVRWGRVLLGGLAAPLFAIVLTILAVFTYATTLAFRVRGQPDAQRIAHFAGRVGPIGGPVLTMVFTLVVAGWLARRAGDGARLHGVLIGAVAAILVLVIGLAFGGGLNVSNMLAAGLTIAAGWVGAQLVARRGHGS